VSERERGNERKGRFEGFNLGASGRIKRILKGKYFRYGQSVYEPSGHDKHKSEPRCNGYVVA